ncbi:MAG: polysaccharide deacetylase family protein [Clostridia bacterium]
MEIKNEFKRVLIIVISISLCFLIFAWIANTMTIPIATATVNVGVKLPIIMYHSVLKDKARIGKYVISPDLFREDVLFLLDNGYTPIVVKDIIDYAYDGKALPKKPIMITFDDGYYNNLTYIFPIIQELKIKIVISAIGEFTDIYTDSGDLNPGYAHLTWNDIKLMSESGLVEFQNHSYGMHHNDGARKGANIIKGETMDHYKKALNDDIMRMQSRLNMKSGVKATAFAYPFGFSSEASEKAMRDIGFLCTLSCFEKISTISTPDSLFSLGRFNRPGTVSTATFMKKILEGTK